MFAGEDVADVAAVVVGDALEHALVEQVREMALDVAARDLDAAFAQLLDELPRRLRLQPSHQPDQHIAGRGHRNRGFATRDLDGPLAGLLAPPVQRLGARDLAMERAARIVLERVVGAHRAQATELVVETTSARHRVVLLGVRGAQAGRALARLVAKPLRVPTAIAQLRRPLTLLARHAASAVAIEWARAIDAESGGLACVVLRAQRVFVPHGSSSVI